MSNIRLVAATRATAEAFPTETLLGRSLPLLQGYLPQLVVDLACSNERGLPEVYNEAMARSADDDILVFLHDDVSLDDWLLPIRLNEALRQFHVVGVAGNRRRLARQPAWAFTDDRLQWDSRDKLSGMIAHDGAQGRRVSVFGGLPAPVRLLDGVFMAVRAGNLKNSGVRFDPRFRFHFYDMDFCRSCEQAGLKMGTWPIALTHKSSGAFGGAAWRAGLAEYRRKWPD